MERINQAAAEEVAAAAARIGRGDPALADLYRRQAAALSDQLAPLQLTRWSAQAEVLANSSRAVAEAMLRNVAAALETASPRFINDWLAACADGHEAGGAGAAALAGLRFDRSAAIMGQLGLNPLLAIYHLLTPHAEGDPREVAALVERIARIAPLLSQCGDRFARWFEAHHAGPAGRIESALALLQAHCEWLPSGGREEFVDLSTLLGGGNADGAADVLEALGRLRLRVGAAQAVELNRMALKLARSSATAGRRFALDLPRLLEIAEYEYVEHWYREGIEHGYLERLEDHFGADPDGAAHPLNALRGGVLCNTVERGLGVYAGLLLGRPAKVVCRDREREDPAPAPEGAEHAITLPDLVNRAPERGANHQLAKALVTQQAGYRLAGSHDGRGGDREELRRLVVDGGDALAADLLRVAENHRVSTALRRRYRGLDETYRTAQRLCLAGRRDPARLPGLERAVELLARHALGDDSQPPDQRAAELMRRVEAEYAGANAAIAAALELRELLKTVPNTYPDGAAEVGYRPLEEVPLWEAFQPLGMLLEGHAEDGLEEGDADEGGERGGDRSGDTSRRGEGEAAEEGDAAAAEAADDGADGDADAQLAEGGSALQEGAAQPAPLSYDEWDHYRGLYRRGWCSLYPRGAADGDGRLYPAVMAEYGHLANRIKSQMETLAVELYRKRDRLTDGDEINLDDAIASLVDLRSGNPPSDKLYRQRQRRERWAAVVFLIDISASTAETVGTAGRFGQGGAHGRLRSRRVIDLEMASIVLLARALEHLGDTYGVCAFSGYGRERIDHYTVKGLDERISAVDMARRLETLTPQHATRMGAAIRHSASLLRGHDALSKYLFLISDGRPQDKGYSRDGTDREYAIHDTRMALVEAKRDGIEPFCITIDHQGNDYMGLMMSDFGYEVLSDVSLLPARLPQLYKRLTVAR